MTTTPTNLQAAAAQDDPRWQAVVARDAGADGRFYYSVKTTGVYCRPSCRARLARPENVRFHLTVEAAEAAGFRPCKRCRPDQSRGIENSAIRYAVEQCSLGPVLVARSDHGICAILLGDDRDALVDELKARFPDAGVIAGGVEIEQQVTRVIEFIDAPGTVFDLPLDVRGTAFQQRVWQALREIPVGSTASYADVARRIGSPRAVRAVAGACAANALAVAIPCHRVVRNNGALSGYRWSVGRKRALLEREARA